MFVMRARATLKAARCGFQFLRSATGLCASLVLFSSTVHAQVADSYRGTVVNASLRDRPATLELSIFSRSDTSIIGWLSIGPPLGGTGVTTVVLSDIDSLYLVTLSVAGDTIVWGSSTRSGAIGGDYWIKGGSSSGQGGTWRLEPRARVRPRTLLLSSFLIAGAGLLGAFTFAVLSCERWWRWREAAPLSGVTKTQISQWSSVGGWLGWIVVANCLVWIYLLATIPELASNFRDVWMLGAALPSWRPLLLIESAGHLFQLLGIAAGLILILRRSHITPPYWVGFLALTALYGLYDIVSAGNIAPTARSIFGAQTGSEFTSGIAEIQRLNLRLLVGAAIWILYWMRSRRVRLEPIS